MLHILQYSFLSNMFLDLFLSFYIKGIIIQSLKFLLML
jgi:hypothetical protein